jgi:hypothetical protein
MTGFDKTAAEEITVMTCYDTSHYIYGFFGILMIYFYYPTYLLIYPIS